MNEIILFSNGCPNCIQLEKELKERGIKYEKHTDVQEMLSLGFDSVPMLSVNGRIVDGEKAMKLLLAGGLNEKQ